MAHTRNNFITTPKDEMRTPPSLFRKLNERFHLDLDTACTRNNCLCESGIFHDEGEDALEQEWVLPPFNMDKGIYCNPPYNRNLLPKFIEKGFVESIEGRPIVMLLPVDFSAKWWDYCMLASEWIRIKGRVHFNGEDGLPIQGSPFFSSVVVVFDPKALNENGFQLSEMSWK